MTIKDLCKDPFRLLFPVAIALALYPCIYWMIYAFAQKGTYPVDLHAQSFIGGYLYLTIIGFLMTAIPRFTKTEFAQRSDILFAGILALFVSFSIIIAQATLLWTSISIGWVHLFFFAIRRFLNRKENPPFTFLFVGLGVLIGFIGSVSLGISEIIELNFIDLERLGKVFFYDGMVMALILGIGGRLIPGILGLKEVVKAQRELYERPEPFLKLIPKDIFISAILFIISLVLDILDYELTGYSLRAIVITYIGIYYWNIHKKPTEKKVNNLYLRLSCFFLMVASWLIVFFPDYLIHIKHLIYIAGYSLMTFLVAARVALAHGDSGLELEKRHYPFSVFGGLLLFAALTRATAIFIPASYISHLGYTALLYFVSLIFWIIVFLPKVLKFK